MLPGDVLLLYSDGLLDASGAKDRFGPDRLLEALEGTSSATDAIARVERALSRFEVRAQADDTAVLAVQRIGVPSCPAPPAAMAPQQRLSLQRRRNLRTATVPRTSRRRGLDTPRRLIPATVDTARKCLRDRRGSPAARR